MELWRPTEQQISLAYLTQFQRLVEQRTGKTFANYDELQQWSCTELAAFWNLTAEFTKVKWSIVAKSPYLPPHEKAMRGAEWFLGSRLNFAENMLPEPSEKIVITAYQEGKSEPEQISAQTLHQQVAAVQQYLSKAGVNTGDRVAGVLSNGSAAVVAMLATTALGAVWTSCSPDFGLQAILDRFSQVEPKVLLLSASYVYGGKTHQPLQLLTEIIRQIPSIQAVVLVDPWQKKELPNEPIAIPVTHYEDILAHKAHRPITFVQLPFSHPVYIMYSSGTTGKPKCIVHGAGGTTLQHKKELQLHSNIGPESNLLYFTTCGWMMWNWMVSALGLGARITLFDGSPVVPDAKVLWQIVAKEQVTAFGLSPRLIAMTMQAGVEPKEMKLEALRTVLSTGSPLLPEHSVWVYQAVKKDVHLASISGGTDIISCFMLGNPCLPVYPGEIQCAGLGMAIDAWDENGKSLREQRGELVCTKPFPSMPVGFWRDLDGSKFYHAYFDYYQHREVWRHGDFIEINAHHGIVVHGRSDTTLNPGGVRIGTAELYRVVEMTPWVVDSLAISRERHTGDPEIALFVKCKNGLPQEWRQELKQKIRQNLSPRHVPQGIYQVSDIPYTRSGKKVELAVFDAVHGREVKNRDAMANPEAVDVCVKALQEGERT